jgi:hypothetical protein
MGLDHDHDHDLASAPAAVVMLPHTRSGRPT